ncbi:MAG: HAD hydrolase-like protein, partial [Planctomycetota bacterium]
MRYNPAASPERDSSPDFSTPPCRRRERDTNVPRQSHNTAMPRKAVVFDLDGTLLDTLADLADSTNAALQTMGYPTHAVDAYRWFVGDGVVNLARRALPET